MRSPDLTAWQFLTFLTLFDNSFYNFDKFDNVYNFDQSKFLTNMTCLTILIYDQGDQET